MNNFLAKSRKYWENRKSYIEIMQKFVNEEIDGRQFNSQFCQMWRIDRDISVNFEELLNELEEIDKIELIKIEDFSSLMSKLFTDCDVFEPDSTLREDYEISEKELQNEVKKTLLKIKDY